MIEKLEGGQTEWGQFLIDVQHSVLAPPYGRYDGPFDGITQIVMEDFLIYPQDVGPGPPPPWDQVITARVIGAIQQLADMEQVPVAYQGADIKSDALRGAAAEDFSRPLHDNRHENDATMHANYYLARASAGQLDTPPPFGTYTLLAIDPGETVGWAIYEYRP